METRSMLDKLILYFVCTTEDRMTKTQLVQFLYLADLNSVKWTQKTLTNLDWYYYSHGIWHKEIGAALDRLNGTIDLLSAGKDSMVRSGVEPFDLQELSLSRGLRLMLDNIRIEWIDASLEDLLDYVYSTEPIAVIRKQDFSGNCTRLNLQLEHQRLLADLGL
jgi:hypothetical protein